MLITVSNLRGMELRARDGTIGSLDDLYFDEATWAVRYLVVDTGTWLSSRRVLIAPQAFGQPDVVDSAIPVHLTRDQVRGSPDIDAARSVSRDMEQALYRHYGWTPYWGEAGLPLDTPQSGETRADANTALREAEETESSEPHLRSAETVMNYYIHARDGDIGHVEDFLVDTEAWALRYMIVDTRNWLPGRKVLISPQWIEDVSWSEETVLLDLTQAQVRDSPEYDPSRGVERDYESRLFEYYSRAPYW